MLIAHLDLDAFFAAVEELERPELVGRPLVVGGDPHGRGVVATANYAARAFGIRSAMSCAEALRRCPDALFVPPSKGLYSEYSRAVWKAVGEVVPRVERTGLDEGYLDVSSVTHDFSEARRLAEVVQAAVRGSTSLTCSIGLAACKVVAKIASDCRKPGGLTAVRPGGEATFLAPFDIRRLPGIGPRAEERLRAANIATIGALADVPDETLRALLPGKVGTLLRNRARGIDPRAVELSLETVSIGHEETFARDISDPGVLDEEVRRMAVRVAERLARGGHSARTVTTKLRYADFSLRSRSFSLPVGTRDPKRLEVLASSLLDRALAERPGALRLLGVSVSNLEDHMQLGLEDAWRASA